MLWASMASLCSRTYRNFFTEAFPHYTLFFSSIAIQSKLDSFQRYLLTKLHFEHLRTVLPDETLVTWLLSHGADPNLGTPGATLNAAACSSTLAVFELLLQHGADVSHCTPLHAAAGASEDAGRIPMLTYLIDELGFDVDADDGMKGMRSLGTPLHYAIRVGGVEKVRFFRDKGASLERRNRMGSTALEEAEKTAYGEVIQVLKGAE